MMTSVRLYLLAVSNAVSPCCDGEVGRAEVEAAAPGGEGGGWAARRGGAAPAQGPSPQSLPRPLAPTPPTPPSSALCAIAHLVLEARVGPRLEQRRGAESVAVVSREVQRRPLPLPRRGGGPTHAAERQAGGRAGGGCLRRMRTPSPLRVPAPPQPRSLPLPACMRAGRPRARSRQRGGSAARRRRGAAAPAGHRPPAGQRGSGAQPPPLTP